MKESTKYSCSHCGTGARVVRGAYHLKEVGLRNVILQGVRLIRCEACGNEDPMLERLNEIMRMLALAVIRKPYRLAGEEVRFLRKYLRMTQEQFARLLRVDRTTLAKWENSEDRVGQQSDLLIRLLTIGLGEGLHEKAAEIIREFPQIRDSRRRVRIEVDARNLEYAYA